MLWSLLVVLAAISVRQATLLSARQKQVARLESENQTLGREVGRSLSRADQAAANHAQTQAQTAPFGQPISWSNPESGNSGTVTPTRDGKDASGNQCREYRTTVTVGGKQEEAYGTACRQPDGSWRVVN